MGIVDYCFKLWSNKPSTIPKFTNKPSISGKFGDGGSVDPAPAVFSLLLHVSSSAFSPISGARRLISSILEDVAQRHPTSAGNPWDGVTEVWLKSYGISAFIGVWCINGQFSTVQSPEGPYGFLSIFNLHFIWEMIFGTEHCKVFTPIPSQCQTPPNEILI